MAWNTKSVHGFSLLAQDGELGAVKEFYFDDAEWEIRYLVVDTGPWLIGRKVLISPAVVGQPDIRSRTFPVELTKEQVKESPHIDSDKPVSRQHEEALTGYYGWPVYWGPMVAPTAVLALKSAEADAPPREDPSEPADRNLRSELNVIGFDISANDDEIGHVDGFLVDDDGWRIRYLVVDTRNWLPGGIKVLVSTDWVRDVGWSSRRVRVDLSVEEVRNSPTYDPDRPVDRDFEQRLHDHYGVAPYWPAVLR